MYVKRIRLEVKLAIGNVEKREEGRLIVKQNRITKANPHNHAPDPGDAIIQMYVSQMKEKFSNTRETTASVINREVEQIPRGFRPYLPAEQVIKRTLQRHRRRDQPRLPKSLTEINVTGNNDQIFKLEYLSP